jgi:hypothetical protein
MTWFIVASGPSLTREDVALLEGQRVLVVNNGYLLAPWATALYGCDGHWWDRHIGRPEMKAFKGRRITRDKGAAERHGLEYVRSFDAPGLAHPPCICENGNSGAQAINLAAHWLLDEPPGERRIVLLGFDMQTTGGRVHWHEKHPSGVNPDERTLARWRVMFDEIAKDARQMGIEIINCSRETALRCFPRAPLESLLTGCASLA